MKTAVFIGPSVSVEDASAVLDATFLPPAAQGDVYRVARQGVTAIGLVDGYFERIPAVWHKEILWAMSEGVHVFGSASMGALRAAELAPFGMRGVGRIFEAFRDGQLDADDEVAVLHGPPEFGYRAVTEALVNVRATIDRAVLEGVVSQAAAWIEMAARLHYADRTWHRILEDAEALPALAADCDRLRAWLPGGRVHQKRDDALEMLRVMRDFLAAAPPPLTVNFHMEPTVFWQSAVEAAGLLLDEGAVSPDGVLDEVRLDPARAAQVRTQAMARHLALRLATQEGLSPGDQEGEPAGDRDAWMAANALSGRQYADYRRDEALIRRVHAQERLDPRRVIDQLRASGVFPDVLARAREKQARLASLGLSMPSPEDLGLTAEALIDWHFETTGGTRRANLKEYARDLGFEHEDEMLRALAREYAYRRALQSE